MQDRAKRRPGEIEDGGSADRGRLTPVDVLLFGAAALVLLLMAGPWYTMLSQNASELGAGSGYVFQLVFPVLVITLLYCIYVTGASGGGR